MVFRFFATAAMLSLLGACSTMTETSSTQQDLLVDRATQRWEALVERDWSKAYTFTSPAYRELFSEALYVRKFSYMVEWELTSVEFLNYDAPAAVASVAVGVMSRPTKLTSVASRAIGSVPTRIVENWVLVDGEWWYSANL